MDVVAKPRASVGSRSRVWIVGLVVAVAIGALLSKGLGDAAVYFRTADEAVAERDSLSDRRFRVEGIVVAGSVEEDGDAVRFDIEENGTTLGVVHQGDPPELFQPNIPVVLEGRFAKGDKHFSSDRILVKHTEQYEEENPDRVDDYVGEERPDPSAEGAAP